MTRLCLIALLFCCAAPLLADEAAKPAPAPVEEKQDTLTTTGEETLVGKFVKIEDGKVFFESDALGLQKVEIGDVESIELAGARTMYRRVGDADHATYEKLDVSSKDGKLMAGDKALDLSKAGLVLPAPPDERANWMVALHASFGWTEGNTRTFQADARFDIVRDTRRNYMTLFGEANYAGDREAEEDKVQERNFLLGFAYRYIFDFNLTIDFTQDFYFNELAGYHYRSITGLGPGYYFSRKPELTAHLGAHLVYVYEDLIRGAEDKGYFGARLRGEVDTLQFDESLHVNFKTELIFDFSDGKNIMWNSQLMVDYAFLEYFTAGLLIRHAYDNVPPDAFKRHDWFFMFTVGFSWGGKWY